MACPTTPPWLEHQCPFLLDPPSLPTDRVSSLSGLGFRSVFKRLDKLSFFSFTQPCKPCHRTLYHITQENVSDRVTERVDKLSFSPSESEPCKSVSPRRSNAVQSRAFQQTATHEAYVRKWLSFVFYTTMPAGSRLASPSSAWLHTASCQ